MPEQGNNRRSLSEISHLFLSSVRERQMSGAAMPRRKPPTARVSVDLTPEECRQVLREESGDQPCVPPVKAVIASHLGGKQLEYVRQYARHLAGRGRHVGLMVIDAGEFRLLRFDPGCAEETLEAPEVGCFDARAMTDAINELNCDLDCWLLLIGNPRIAEGRALLAQTRRWVVLGTCDHEGVVACYRALKGLSDLHEGVERLTFAALEARDAAEAESVHRKLAGVCAQFMSIKVHSEDAVGAAEDVGEAGVMNCVVEHDKAQLAGAAHWQVVEEFLQQARQNSADEAEVEAKLAAQEPAEAGPMAIGDAAAEQQDEQSGAGEEKGQAAVMRVGQRAIGCEAASDVAEVIDLPAGQEGEENVLAAVMKHSVGQMVECPVRPPMGPETRLAVSREKRLVLIAVARNGMDDLKLIGQAYRWVMENRVLLAMAMPQFSLDAHQLPHLRLLVNQADMNADVLRGMFAAETVQVQTYRRVRWGERRGVLLEAA